MGRDDDLVGGASSSSDWEVCEPKREREREVEKRRSEDERRANEGREEKLLESTEYDGQLTNFQVLAQKIILVSSESSDLDIVLSCFPSTRNESEISSAFWQTQDEKEERKRERKRTRRDLLWEGDCLSDSQRARKDGTLDSSVVIGG